MDLKVGSAIRPGSAMSYFLIHTKFKLRLFDFLLACNGFVWMPWIETGGALL